jgi:hypothetical protein
MPPMNKPIWIAVVAAAVALAACSKKEGEGSDKHGKFMKQKEREKHAANTTTCESAITKAVTSLPAGPDGVVVQEKLHAIYTKSCNQDRWSADVIKCFESASGMQGLMACRGRLPPEIGTKLRSEIQAAMMSAAATMGRPGMGHGGMGSGAPDGSAAPAGGSAAPAAGSAPGAETGGQKK